MAQGFCECWSFFKVTLKKLVRKMLGKEGEHETGLLWIRVELFS